MCPGVRTTSQSASPRRRTCPSSSASSTVYGATGWSRYSASAAARVAAGDGVGVRGAGRDAGAAGLEQGVAADVVGVPVGVHDQVQVGVRACTHAAVSSAWPTKPLSTRAGWRPSS